ncbi:MAG TPA: NAD(P)-dependent oxidoreductase [Streptosporangiaceae bacterium]|jgi:nucleoside-diphosphate-sugar epimerase|nr:NAD(P)-dependent oxidoreductase [Streptosporangiaceae bacterium]
MRVFVAGGTGAMGRYLIPALVADGHEVTASTRAADRSADLTAAGAVPAVMDGLDRDSVLAAVQNAAPEVIVHQMTALGVSKDFRRFDEEFAVTNQLRTRGTDNLLEAARRAGTRRFIAQSFTGFTNEYAGTPVKTEDEPLNPDPPASARQTLAAIRYVDETVPKQAPEGIVLRYGLFYGHGASNGTLSAIRAGNFPIIGGGTGIWSFCEITDGAAATAAAVTRGAPGVYNIVDDEPAPAAEWVPFLARCLGAEAPREVPAALGRELAGEFLTAQMTVARGSSNAKAKRELGWAPRYASWREGFGEWAKSAE